MARTNPTRVAEIIQVTDSLSISPFIATATALTDWLVSQDSNGELSKSLLVQIETYLAAHFYSHRDQLYQSKSHGGASGSFQGQSGMMLKSTQYGQTAIVLDVTGNLAKRDEGRKQTAGAYWLGTEAD